MGNILVTAVALVCNAHVLHAPRHGELNGPSHAGSKVRYGVHPCRLLSQPANFTDTLAPVTHLQLERAVAAAAQDRATLAELRNQRLLEQETLITTLAGTLNAGKSELVCWVMLERFRTWTSPPGRERQKVE